MMVMSDEEEETDLAKAVVVAGCGGGAVCTAIVIISLIALNVREAFLAHLPLRPLLAVIEGRRLPGERGMRRRRQPPPPPPLAVPLPPQPPEEEEEEEDGMSDDSDGEEDADDEEEDEESDDDDDDDLVVNNFDGHDDRGGPLGLGAGFLLLDNDDDDGLQQPLGGDPVLDLQQLLGLHVPLRAAVRRWSRFLCYNLMFLTVFQLAPYQLGVNAWAWAQQLDPSPLTSLIEYTKTAGEMLLVGEVEALLSRGIRSSSNKGEGGSVNSSGGGYGADRLSGGSGLPSHHHPSSELLERIGFLGLGYCILIVVLVLICIMLLVGFAFRHPSRMMRSARH